jgi:CHAT domain-containing protein
MRQMLFPPQIWGKFVECVTSVTAQGKGLRLRLRIDPPELDQWPWEYCYDEQYDFIAQNSDTPLVRSPAELTAPRMQRVPRPLRVLVVVANPEGEGLAKLDPEPELANIQNALTDLLTQGLITIEELPQPITAERLLKVLRRKQHDVLHYFGHGLVLANGQGALALENEDNSLHTVDADQLRVMFRNSSVRVAFLNACNLATHEGGESMNSVARSLTRTGVAAVIAMQYKLPQSSAHLFSRSLYESLATGHPLDQALSDARSTAYVIRGDKVYWGIPVLTMRAADGKIW